jgi:hypothetical protein
MSIHHIIFLFILFVVVVLSLFMGLLLILKDSTNTAVRQATASTGLLSVIGVLRFVIKARHAAKIVKEVSSSS